MLLLHYLENLFMKKTLISLMLLSLYASFASSETILNGDQINDTEILPISSTPIKEKTLLIDPKPIDNSNIKTSSSEIDKLKKNSGKFFNEIKNEINSPVFEYQGQTYNKQKVADVDGGKIVLTPIKEKEEKVDVVLPKGLEEIKSDVEWVDYSEYQKRLAKEQQQNKTTINKPDGFYDNDQPSNYIDNFFDNTIVDTNKNKSNIKESLNELVDSYKEKDTQKNKPNNSSKFKPISNDHFKPNLNNMKSNTETKPVIEKSVALDNGFKNIVDLYSNPDRKETLGYINNDIIKSTPMAIMSHNIPEYLKGKPIYIRIFKENNSLEFYLLDHGKYKLANVYTICTFSGGLGPKKRQGDQKSPEGFYTFKTNGFNPYSQYHKSIDLGFPNAYDQAHGYNGSLLMVHGGCKSVGCYAMTDSYIEEIYQFAQAALKNGQDSIQVDIFPFKMTDQNMKKYKNNENYAFWKEIKTGYDIFEKTGKPPIVSSQGKKYIFN